ncbi:uncharacterized protein LOC128954425 [Oppia nitens]|uniref:uncharacterized protein LOC128954425 n=1 Tax=Oppia nitens TaxID=1686743 RepID=UPI0023D9FF7F|nr:uncharacterized protein LOC128954425 [Oppia nitens]
MDKIKIDNNFQSTTTTTKVSQQKQQPISYYSPKHLNGWFGGTDHTVGPDIIGIIDMQLKNLDEFDASLRQSSTTTTTTTAVVVVDDNNVEELTEKLSATERERDVNRDRLRELESRLADCEKELREVKRINDWQENCIETNESEIQRLRECLNVTEMRVQETIEISEEIIVDLTAKLKITTDELAVYKCQTLSGTVSGPTGADKANNVEQQQQHYIKHNLTKGGLPHHHQSRLAKHMGGVARALSPSRTPSFYVELNDSSSSTGSQINNSGNHSSDYNKCNNKTTDYYLNNSKLKLKVLTTEMDNLCKQFTVSAIRQLWPQKGTSGVSVSIVDTLADKLANKLNDKFGRQWNCWLMSANSSSGSSSGIHTGSLNYQCGTYMLCSLNKCWHLFVATIGETPSPQPPPPPTTTTVSQQLTTTIEPVVSSADTTDPTAVRIFKRSVNLEAPIERMIINIALDAISSQQQQQHLQVLMMADNTDSSSSSGDLNSSLNLYQTVSVQIRDQICSKYNSQWFVSVGGTHNYSTSWALARSRKFLLFEVSNVKFTVAEVGFGWLW